MLSVMNLRKRFGPIEAVSDVSFTIPKGCCFGLLGPNGAGKTTAISMICGTLDPDSGSVSILGEPISTKNPHGRRQIGYVPQEIALYEPLTAHDNLRFFGALYGIDDNVLPARMSSALTTVGLDDRADEPVKNFSGGMKRRLNIAIALLHEPQLLVLDEPTVGVDPQSRNAIFDALLALKAKGTTLLYTTHYMEEVERLCDRVAVMDHGKLMAEDSQQNLKKLIPTQSRVTIDLSEAVDMEGCPWPLTLEELKLTLDVKDMNADLPEVLNWLKSKGATYQSLETQKASLEEVFLHLTGRALRD